jgi:hypothetical protein
VKGGTVLIVLLWLWTLVLGLITAASGQLSHRQRGLGRLAVAFVVAASGEFWLIMLTEGPADVYKHMVYTNLLMALCIPISIACFAQYKHPLLMAPFARRPVSSGSAPN